MEIIEGVNHPLMRDSSRGVKKTVIGILLHIGKIRHLIQSTLCWISSQVPIVFTGKRTKNLETRRADAIAKDGKDFWKLTRHDSMI